MSLTTIAINGVPIEDRGFTLQSVTGPSALAQRSYQQVQGPLILGARRVAAGSGVGVRTFTLAQLLRPTSLADRQAILDDFASEFQGTVAITKADAPTRACYGELDQGELTPPPNATNLYLRPESVLTITIVCADPLYYDLDPVLTNIAAGERRAIGMGNAPLRKLLITQCGAATNPTLTLRDQTGTVAETMALTGTLGATEYATIDCGVNGRSILKSDGTDLLAAGWLAMPQTFFFPRPPMTATAPPTLESSAGALRVACYRAWWN